MDQWRAPLIGDCPRPLFSLSPVWRLNLEVEGDRVADLQWRGSKETKLNVTGTKVGGYVVKLRLYSQVAEMRIWTEGRRFENHDKLRNLSPKLLHSPREIPNRAEKARRRPENRAVSKESPSCREGSRNSYPLAHLQITPHRARPLPRDAPVSAPAYQPFPTNPLPRRCENIFDNALALAKDGRN